MEILVSALIVLVLANLLLTFGVIRRLREHTQKMADMQSNSFTPFQSLEPGTVVPEFATASTTTGGKFSRADLQNGMSIVAFHSVDCRACEMDAPAMTARLQSEVGEDVSAYVVVAVPPESEEGSDKHLNEITESLQGSAAVIREPLSTGPVQSAFKINSYPSYVVVDPEGRVVTTAHATRDLPRDLSAIPQHRH